MTKEQYNIISLRFAVIDELTETATQLVSAQHYEAAALVCKQIRSHVSLFKAHIVGLIDKAPEQPEKKAETQDAQAPVAPEANQEVTNG